MSLLLAAFGGMGLAFSRMGLVGKKTAFGPTHNYTYFFLGF